MDKKSLLAIALITVIIIFLPTYYDMVGVEEPPTPDEGKQINQQEQNESKPEVIKQQVNSETKTQKETVPAPTETILEENWVYKIKR